MKKTYLITGLTIIALLSVGIYFIFFGSTSIDRQLKLVYARDAGDGGSGACADNSQCPGGEFCAYFPTSCDSNDDCSSCINPVFPFTPAICTPPGLCYLPLLDANCGSCLLDSFGGGGSSGYGPDPGGEECEITDPGNFTKLAIKAPGNEDVAFFTELGDLAIYGVGWYPIFKETLPAEFNDLKNNVDGCSADGEHYYYEIKNDVGATIAMFWYCSKDWFFQGPEGRLYIAGAEVIENFDIPDDEPADPNNFVIHSNNFPGADAMAYFDNDGNLYLRGCIDENYNLPSGL